MDLSEILKLADIINQFSPLPAYSIMLGVCDDGLPLMLDLTEPGAGSFLIAGDRQSANRAMIRCILETALSHATDREIRIHYFANEEEDIAAKASDSSSQKSIRFGSREAGMVIEGLWKLIGDREKNNENIPIHLLILDHLEKVLEYHPSEKTAELINILQYGPSVGVWAIGAVETRDINTNLFELIEAFPSRIISKVEDKAMARYLTGVPYADLSDLSAYEAFIRAGQDLFSVTIPAI